MGVVMKTIHHRASEKTPSPSGSKAVACSGLAFMCLSGGLFAPILGLVFIIIHSAMDDDVIFSEIGTGLMISAIPLLLAGSHFLDVWDAYRKKAEEKDDVEEQ